jgi:hypothetical protein
MICAQCGTENPEGAEACSECGVSLQTPSVGAPAYGVVQPTSSMAMVSLILGILGWTVLPVIGSVVAVVFGHLGLSEIDRSGDQLSGRGMAQVGLILGYSALAVQLLSVVLFVVLPIFGCGFCSLCSALGSVVHSWS